MGLNPYRKQHMNVLAKSLAASALLFAFSPLAAEAQSQGQTWSLTAGAAMIYAPAYLGANNYQLSAFPSLQLRYGDSFFASLEEGVGYNLVNGGGWKAGPIARYDFGRREDESSPFRIAGKRSGDLRGLGDVDGAVELGGFAGYSEGPWSAKAEVRHGVNGYAGVVGDLEAKYTARTSAFGSGLIISAGPRLKFAGSKYTTAYFGIDAGQSLRSGLSRYAPGGGILSYGAGGAVIAPLEDRLSLVVFAGYDRLADGAANSPLVKVKGTPNQAIMGVSLGYAF